MKIFLFFLSLSCFALANDQRDEAIELLADKKPKLARPIFKKLIQSESNEHTGEDIVNYIRTMYSEQKDIDRFLEKASEDHKENAHAQFGIARAYQNLVDKVYFEDEKSIKRGKHEDLKEYTIFAFDRVQTLRHLERARQLVIASPKKFSKKWLRQFYREYAEFYLKYTSPDDLNRLAPIPDSLKLSDLSKEDLEQEPDSSNPFANPFLGGEKQEKFFPFEKYDILSDHSHYVKYSQSKNPVDFFALPKSMEAAKSNGERMQLIRFEAKAVHPKLAAKVDEMYADFLESQLGILVHGPYSEEYNYDTLGDGSDPSDFHERAAQLKDEEVLLRFLEPDSGFLTFYKKIRLPDEHNFLKIRQRLYQEKVTSGFRLAQIYLARSQYERAVKTLENSEIRDPRSKTLLERLQGSFVSFEKIESSFIAGEKPTLKFSARNVESISFQIQEIDIEAIVDDAVETLSQLGSFSDYRKAGDALKNHTELFAEDKKFKRLLIGDPIIHQEEYKPRKYRDESHEVTLPIEAEGTYLLTAELKNGNSYKLVISLDSICIVAKSSLAGTQFCVMSARDGSPQAHASIELFSYSGKFGNSIDTSPWDYDSQANSSFLRQKVKADENGQFILPSSFSKHSDYWFARARKGKSHSYSQANRLFNAYKEELSESNPRIALITDKPIYKPGETLYGTAILRNLSHTNTDHRYLGSELELFFIAPNYEQIPIPVGKLDQDGFVRFSYKIPMDSKTGRSGLMAFASSVKVYHRFYVQEYRKPEYKIHAELIHSQIRKDKPVEVKITADYFHGEAVKNGELSVDITASQISTMSLPTHSLDWLHDEWYDWKASETLEVNPFADPGSNKIHSGKMDLSDGSALISIPFQKLKQAYKGLGVDLMLHVSFVDKSNKVIRKAFAFPVAGQKSYLLGKPEHPFCKVGEANKIEVISLNGTGTPQKTKGILRISKAQMDGLAEGEDAESVDYEKLTEVPFSTDKNGKWTYSFSQQKPGNYRLHFAVGESSVQFEIIVHDDSATRLSKEHLSIIPLKTTLDHSQQQEYLITTSFKDGFVYLQSSDKKTYTPVKVTGYKARLSEQLDKSLIPYESKQCFAVANAQIYEETAYFIVLPADLELAVELKPEKKKYAPGQSMKLELMVSENKKPSPNTRVILAIYDGSLDYIEGASAQKPLDELWKFGSFYSHYYIYSQTLINSLNKSEEPKPNRFAAYLRPTWTKGQHLLGFIGKKVFSTHTTDQSDGGGGAGDRLYSMGEDSGSISSPNTLSSELSARAHRLAPRSNFKSLLVFESELSTDENGRLIYEIDLPDNLTTWRIHAWAIDEQTRVGQSQASVLVTKDLIARPVLPEYLIEGDTAKVAGIVHNYSGQALSGKTKFTFDTNLLKSSSSKTSFSTNIKNLGGEANHSFALKAEKVGKSPFVLGAQLGDHRDIVHKSLEIHRYGMENKLFQHLPIDSQSKLQSYSLQAPKDIDPDSLLLTLGISQGTDDILFEALPYLLDYEHGCAEQTLNRFLPALICRNALRGKYEQLGKEKVDVSFKHHSKLTAQNLRHSIEKKDLMKKVQESIERLAQFQNYNGGWAWYGRAASNLEISTIVTHGLVRALDSGIEDNLSDTTVKRVHKMTRKGARFLENQLRTKEKLLENLEDLSHDDIFTILALSEYYKKKRKSHSSTSKPLEEMLFYRFLEKLENEHEHLSARSLCKLAIALHHLKKEKSGIKILERAIKLSKKSKSGQQQWLETKYEQTELNGWFLKALVLYSRPEADPVLAYLVEARKQGTHWNSTKDTAVCIDAIASLGQQQEAKLPKQQIELSLNGEEIVSAVLDPKQSLHFPNQIIVPASLLRPGNNILKCEGKLSSSIKLHAKLSFYERGPSFEIESKGITLQRNYYLLRKDKELALNPGDSLKVGDQVRVKLSISNPQGHRYLHLKNPKPAGLVFQNRLSGRISSIEKSCSAFHDLRKSHSNLFISSLGAKEEAFCYNYLVETAGTFTALPASIEAMYRPSIRAHTKEYQFEIDE